MIYFNTDQYASMKANSDNLKLDAILQRIFPDNKKWGACPFFKNGKLDFIEINKLSDLTPNGGATWTHYATIGRYTSDDENNDKWEVYSQFNGEKENELWVFAYYKNFGNAAWCVAKGGIEKLKPIKKYY